MATQVITIEDLTRRVASLLSERRVPRGDGQAGKVTVTASRGVTRTFRAHWTGFKALFPEEVLLLRMDLADGSMWSEGYISPARPSWILAFRRTPPKERGSGGPRPDDKLALPASVEASLAQRQAMIDSGSAFEEELIRMEDYDDPVEATEAFFNYTSLYVLKAASVPWDQLGYEADVASGWDVEDDAAASVPIDEAVDQGLKRSDIIWITPNSGPDRPIPCWFIYKDGHAYVLSGETQQIIPNAREVRDAKVVTRWRGRDVRIGEFEAAVRIIDSDNETEFRELAEKMVAKRQSVREGVTETVDRWLSECVILELKPRI